MRVKLITIRIKDELLSGGNKLERLKIHKKNKGSVTKRR
jgi:hypothetical protein